MGDGEQTRRGIEIETPGFGVSDGAKRWSGRSAGLAVCAVLVVLGLLNVFGQESESRAVEGPRARLDLDAPSRLRSGLIWQAKFEIGARAAIAEPVLVLDGGWLENMSLNTVEPAPDGEATEAGRLALTYPPLAAGEMLTVWLQFQVNPQWPGRHSQGVAVRDGEVPLATLRRSLTVFP